MLLKELQLKRVDKLKINDSTKDKVAEYVIKYMSRFGEFYKRKLGGMYVTSMVFSNFNRYKQNCY